MSQVFVRLLKNLVPEHVIQLFVKFPEPKEEENNNFNF